MRILPAIFLLAAFNASAQKQPEGFYLARSTGKLTMLATGLGEDRLGGTKIGYIDTSVLLKVVDSTKELYYVQLSNNHHVYVSKADVRKDSATHLRPYYLTNSFSVKGDDDYDYVNMSLDEKLPYKSW